ncbi:hypothetical protein BC936DRAFT_146062, partial [Jimgerdemannia flammicorona]
MDEKPNKFNDQDADLSSRFNEKIGLEEDSTEQSHVHNNVTGHHTSFSDESTTPHAKIVTLSTAPIIQTPTRHLSNDKDITVTELGDASVGHIVKEEEEQEVKQASNDPEFQQIITQFDSIEDDNVEGDIIGDDHTHESESRLIPTSE